MGAMSDMKTCVSELKGLLRQFRDERDWLQFHDPKNLAEAISIEAAELLELFNWKKQNEIARSLKRNSQFKNAVEAELTDVLCNVLNFANVINIDLSQAFITKIEANGKTYPVSRSRGIAKIPYEL
jgi:dCTP diphosphatase